MPLKVILEGADGKTEGKLPEQIGASCPQEVVFDAHQPSSFDLPPKVILEGANQKSEVGGNSSDRLGAIPDLGANSKKSGGQLEKSAPQLSKKAKPKPDKSSDKRVLPFLPSRGQKQSALTRAELVGKSSESELPSRGQTLVGNLPPIKRGAGWWEIPADGTGYRIKFRWRVGGKKLVYVFRRLGKKELLDLEGKQNGIASGILRRRLFTELFRGQRRDLAGRLMVESRSDQKGSDRTEGMGGS